MSTTLEISQLHDITVSLEESLVRTNQKNGIQL